MRRFRPGSWELPYLTCIFLGNLLELGAVTGEPRYRAFVERYADRAWRADRRPRSGLFSFQHGRRLVQLLEQAAMARLDALLAASPARSLSQLPACRACPAAP